MDAGRLAHALDRLASTGRVLYIAAHPDDENTRLLAYLANQRHVDAAYLSMTRGGGGQNLIGTEQDELLDVIRTEELLSARRLDGAAQRFTRMRDFGFSKTARESLAIWGHEQALADVVWVIRTFQPDVIITRFDELPPNHGHHTASAILAREAFTAAADPKRFPEQLAAGAAPWQAQRLLLNVPTWREGPPPADALALDVGEYDARLGLGYAELAARSRSQHKSQGFGVAGERGPLIERFLTVAGSKPQRDLLEGLDLGWSRFGPAGVNIAAAFEAARAALDRDRPERALPSLLQARRGLAALPDEPRTRDARVELDEIIAASAGFFVRANAAAPGAVPGSTAAVKVETSMRRPAGVTLRSVTFPGLPSVDVGAVLALNEKREVSRDVPIPADAPVSAPYWLAAPADGGRQVVTDQALVGAPKGPPALAVTLELAIEDQVVQLRTPVVYTWTDRVHGERIRDFLIVPPATITPARQAVMFPNGAAAPVILRVRAGAAQLSGTVSLTLPSGWRAEPAQVPVTLAQAGDETAARFVVTPPAGAAAIEVAPSIDVGGRAWAYREDVIDYAHIPMQVVLRPASLRLVPLTVAVPPGRIGYIPGSGDTIADDLAQIGASVELLDEETIRSGDLSKYAAIVVGIRAYNTRPLLRSAHARLMRYVEHGGTVVVQYNTTNPREPLTVPIGPYPLTVGRGRITDETAAMTPIDPAQPILQTPNAITAADFDAWVQERGLYYGESWDDRYIPIFSAADPDEQPERGGVLVARHGKGRYVYTGLAFFRQLPAGVPGAYRLFANLIARETIPSPLVGEGQDGGSEKR